MNSKWWKLDRKYGYLFGTLFIVSLLYVFPVILANRY